MMYDHGFLNRYFIGANISLTGCTRAADAQDVVEGGGTEVSVSVDISQ